MVAEVPDDEVDSDLVRVVKLLFSEDVQQRVILTA